ncbi:MAG: hypothetical protein K8R25_08495, partial [Methanosarcinales archaeon]|nr:hypothetical protein [Methanosarcinales archaeon]
LYVSNIFISHYCIIIIGGEKMKFILWFEWNPENTEKILKIWKDFKYPEEVKLIDRYLMLGRHISVAIFDAQTEESILKITYPFKDLGIPHIVPALQFEEALEMMEKM